MVTLQVGIISETLVQQHHLRHIVEECSYKVASAYLVNQILSNADLLTNKDQIDVWLVDVDTFALEQNTNAKAFQHWLFDLKQPVLFGEGTTHNAVGEGYNSWVRQLELKLISLAGQILLRQQQQRVADYIWVLAASAGGPEAVKTFLDHLPTGLGVTFLYAQHIGGKHNTRLAQTLTRDSQYECQLAKHGETLSADKVTIVPTGQQIDLLADGTIVLKNEPWRGSYTPSIDQVVATVAQSFGSRSGAIFFSGMGDDGAMGARLMARNNGRIWIQSPLSCVSDSMPKAVNRTGRVEATGTPEQLAGFLEHALKAVAQSVVTA